MPYGSFDSATGAMSDTFDAYEDQVAEFRDKLRYVEGASGMAVTIGDKVVGCDLFDKPSNVSAEACSPSSNSARYSSPSPIGSASSHEALLVVVSISSMSEVPACFSDSFDSRAPNTSPDNSLPQTF